MIESKKQKLIYALITVLITVPCFVLYCLSIEKGGILNVDIKFALLIIPIEFILAYISEIFIGSPFSLKIALSKIDNKKSNPLFFEIAIICSTVIIMCPLMSFYATILYKGIFPAIVFNDPSFTIGKFIINFIPNFLQTITLNFPFALLSQLFFIQPLTKKIFKIIYKK